MTNHSAVEEIVDAHHHLWDYDSPYGRYDLPELLADTAGVDGVTETVFIDCGSNYRTEGPEALKSVGETEWVAGRCDASDGGDAARIAAIVGHANLMLGAAVGQVLDAHIDAGGGRFRGIRHSGARSGTPEVVSNRGEPPADLYRRDEFVAGARQLCDRGLSFEAWQYHHQLGEVVALAREVPDLQIVVNHLGGPIGVGVWAGRWDEVHSDLRRSYVDLAACPNVWMKLGGIGMSRFGAVYRSGRPGAEEVAEVWGDTIRAAIDALGPDRCLFESNYPVDGQTIDYAVLWQAFDLVSADYSPSERADLFAGSARRVYRLG